ncbi:MAG: hypothetical protein WC408_04940 [Candidatus Micrarchaeia archaeon]
MAELKPEAAKEAVVAFVSQHNLSGQAGATKAKQVITAARFSKNFDAFLPHFKRILGNLPTSKQEPTIRNFFEIAQYCNYDHFQTSRKIEDHMADKTRSISNARLLASEIDRHCGVKSNTSKA